MSTARPHQLGVQGVRRVRVAVEGTVQGVGFRPFVYRLARELGLVGWVNNTARGVTIEAQGRVERLTEFVRRVETDRPAHAVIESLAYSTCSTGDCTYFEIRDSDSAGDKTSPILPDLAVCPDCLADILDPRNRRHRYPFTTCTYCGPRYSIVQSLPYDRPNTTMKSFPMCAACASEYNDPGDRRFHAQPIACPDCGPRVSLVDAEKTEVAIREEALREAGQCIRDGLILAVKGLGGYHLMVDARNQMAVRRLRERKHRDQKPFALMYPSLEHVRGDCSVSDLEAGLLCSAESPIVLLERRAAGRLADSVAPGNPYLGVMLPYTPLHYLLMLELGFPVVATSGNLAEEPICTDEMEAFAHLGPIADWYLQHDRPIARPVDDSIVRVMAGRPLILRRARGYTPSPVGLSANEPLPPTLAVGAHLKSTVAVSVGRRAILSQHIGDLDSAPAFESFKSRVEDLTSMHGRSPHIVVHDLHPDYRSTRFAGRLGGETLAVQHHMAHVLACMADNNIDGRALGVAWDGTGYGTDGTIWGGEFLEVNGGTFERTAHLRTFRLPGGERAITEPRRAALGMLYEISRSGGIDLDACAALRTFQKDERRLLMRMLERELNSPVTSSAGRLFDGVAAMLGLPGTGGVVGYEGQAAMMVEFAAQSHSVNEHYPFDVERVSDGAAVIDWESTVLTLLTDLEDGVLPGVIAARFHNTLVEMIVAVAKQCGEERVILTGGCFQNRYLTERSVKRLRESGFQPYWHRRVSPNDGSIALGQLAAAVWQHNKERS